MKGMKAMILYRIEHAVTNVGPYWGANSTNDSRQRDMGLAHTDDQHPSFSRDIDDWKVIGSRYEYNCCFSTVQQLVDWFDQIWLEVMHNNGYVVKVFEIDDTLVIESKYQSFFKRDQATVINTVNCLDVLDLV